MKTNVNGTEIKMVTKFKNGKFHFYTYVYGNKYEVCRSHNKGNTIYYFKDCNNPKSSPLIGDSTYRYVMAVAKAMFKQEQVFCF